jgi:hypothetical protein
MESTKIIVTHRGALEARYGTAAARVFKAVDRLIAADRKRGMTSKLVALDQAGDMAQFRCAPMGNAKEDWVGAKRCVDAIDAAIRPHYFLILGDADIVPMQPLTNVVGILLQPEGLGDDDAAIPSDLPYACDEPASDDPALFQGPTRAVGRLPDLPSARNPDLLVRLLRYAAEAKPLPPKRYARWFALSAMVWRSSTRRTVKRIFGDDSGLYLSPPQERGWSAARLAPRLHYFNCHGGNCDPGFAGQYPPNPDGTEGEQTDALEGWDLRGRVKPGTVVAAECCYGAKVYSTRREDAAKSAGRLPIPLQYLKQGAYGYFGSTTIAYGDVDGNDWADILCRMFVERVLAGCSLGRAALEARIGYLKHAKLNDPPRLKTIAQFHLLGDPSIHPVAARDAGVEAPVEMSPKARALVARARETHRQRSRREALKLKAASQTLVALGEEPPPSVASEFWAEATRRGLRSKLVRVFELKAAAAAAQRGEASPKLDRDFHRIVMLIERTKEELGISDEPSPKRAAKAGAKTRRAPYRRFPTYGGIIAIMRGDKIVKVKRIASR